MENERVVEGNEIVFCTQCGTKIPDSSRYCTACGAAVLDASGKPVAAMSAMSSGPTARNSYAASAPDQVKLRPVMWVMPLTSFVVALLIIGGTYLYQVSVDDDVERSRKIAENYVLKGEMQKAEILLKSALEKRPNHKTIQADLHWIDLVQGVEKLMQTAQEQTQGKDYAKALATLEQAEKQAGSFAGELGDSLRRRITDQKHAVTVAQVKAELDGKQTLEELAPLLTKVADLNLPEAKQAAAEVRKRMAEVALAQAKTLVDQKQFDSALTLINKALGYDASNEQLLAYKEQIASQQTAFEQAEQQRLEQAMIAAAREEEANRTKAVQVVSVEGQAGEYGDYIITGQVKNSGTRPVSDVYVTFTLTNANGDREELSTYVSPYTLQPGETGTFDYTYYLLDESDLKVEVTDVTWMVE
jgi:tetratricopeptide (TPR) repeat protein